MLDALQRLEESTADLERRIDDLSQRVRQEEHGRGQEMRAMLGRIEDLEAMGR